MPVLSVLDCCVTVPDLDDALVFFGDLLGFDVEATGTHEQARSDALLGLDGARARYAIVTCPDHTEIELLEFRSPRGKPRDTRLPRYAGISVLTPIVDDLEATVAPARRQRLSAKR